MFFAPGSLGFVELSGPGRASEAAERPLLHGVAQEAVMGEPTGDDELALARPARHRRLARIALQGVRRFELLGMVADLGCDPGGETVTEAGKAQVDLAAREALPPLVLPGLLGSSSSGRTEQAPASLMSGSLLSRSPL